MAPTFGRRFHSQHIAALSSHRSGGHSWVILCSPRPRPTHTRYSPTSPTARCRHPASAMQAAGLPHPFEHGAITVLVVDSDSASSAATCALLTACAYQVRRARSVRPSQRPLWPPLYQRSLFCPQALAVTSGAAALRLVEERAAAGQGVHIVLKDHNPPASNAVRFLRRLREHATPALRDTPVIGALWSGPTSRRARMGKGEAAGPSFGAPAPNCARVSSLALAKPLYSISSHSVAPGAPGTHRGARATPSTAAGLPCRRVAPATRGAAAARPCAAALTASPALRPTAAAVTSNQDDRDVVLKCLTSGAADYWVRPLRPNEVRVLWTRLWRQEVGPHPASAARCTLRLLQRLVVHPAVACASAGAQPVVGQPG